MVAVMSAHEHVIAQGKCIVPPCDVEPTRKAQCARLLELLRDGEWHQHAEMVDAASTRFSARVFDLRKAGHPIESKRITTAHWEYRLPKKPGQIKLL